MTIKTRPDCIAGDARGTYAKVHLQVAIGDLPSPVKRRIPVNEKSSAGTLLSRVDCLDFPTRPVSGISVTRGLAINAGGTRGLPNRHGAPNRVKSGEGLDALPSGPRLTRWCWGGSEHPRRMAGNLSD